MCWAGPRAIRWPLAYPPAEADLWANLRRLGVAAGLSETEWAECAERVRERIGMDLGAFGR